MVDLELSVKFLMDLLSQPRDHHSLYEELIAQEDHDEIDDESEPDFGDEVPGIREDRPGIQQDVISVLMAVAMIFCVGKQAAKHADSLSLLTTVIDKDDLTQSGRQGDRTLTALSDGTP